MDIAATVEVDIAAPPMLGNAAQTPAPNLGRIDERFQEMRQARDRANLAARWYLAERVRDGRLEYYLDPITRQVVRDDAIANMSGLWDNILEPLLRIRVTRIASQVRQMQCPPDSNTETERRKAQGSTMLARYFQYKHRFRDVLKDSIDYVETYGKVFLHAYYDPTAPRCMPLVVDSSQPPSTTGLAEGVVYDGRRRTQEGATDVYSGPFGDAQTEIVLPHSIYVPAGAADLETCEDFFRVHSMPVSEIQRRWPQFSKNIKSESVADMRSGDSDRTSTAGMDLRSDSVADEVDGVRLTDKAGQAKVFEYWKKRAAQWERTLYCQGIVLAHEFLRHHGYTEVAVWRVAGKMFPKSNVLRCLPALRQAARMQIKMSRDEERRSKPILALYGSYELVEDDDFIIVVMPLMENPVPPTITLMPSNMDQQLELFNHWEDRLKNNLHIFPIATGDNSGVTSGVGLDRLIEQISTIMEDERERVDGAVALHFERLLQVAHDNYDAPAITGIFGAGEESWLITDEVLSSSPKVRVLGGSVLPQDKGKRLALLAGDLKEIIAPGNEEMAARVAAIMGASEDEIAILSPGSSKVHEEAEREHRAMEEGAMGVMAGADGTPKLYWNTGAPVVEQWQNHKAELIQHIEFTYGDKFVFQWDAQQQGLMRQMIMEHSAFLSGAQTGAATPQIAAGSQAGMGDGAQGMPGSMPKRMPAKARDVQGGAPTEAPAGAPADAPLWRQALLGW